MCNWMQIQNCSGETKSRGAFRAHPCNWVCLYLDWMAKYQLILHPLYRIVAHSCFVQVSGKSDLFIDLSLGWKKQIFFNFTSSRKLVCCIWLPYGPSYDPHCCQWFYSPCPELVKFVQRCNYGGEKNAIDTWYLAFCAGMEEYGWIWTWSLWRLCPCCTTL